MAKHILDYLEYFAGCTPNKEVYEDRDTVLTYGQTMDLATRIGTSIMGLGVGSGQPVAIFMEKSVKSVISFLGTLYSGNFYCPLDTKMPSERIQTIMGVLTPRIILTDLENLETAKAFSCNCFILLWEDMIKAESNYQKLLKIRHTVTELDPLYVLFTSGSTGVPKGVILNHRVVTNYMEWLGETFSLDSGDVFGNQAPLYFDVSIHDVYGALFFGAKMCIVPQEMFSFPVKLVEYMNEKKVSTILWVPSAMGIVAKLNAFSCDVPKYLKHVMFAGEVLARKHLDYWVSYLPDVVYANLYGPTETFVCTAYIRTGKEPEGEVLPIGKPIFNSQALVLDDEGRLVNDGEAGELCMRGCCLALGYYNNEEQTRQAFTQNPLHDCYGDRIYHTRDLVRYDADSQLVYLSRKDFQIKHMGYRIELGEIEAAANLVEGIRDCACVYDEVRKRIILFYEGGEWERKALLNELSLRIPVYMLPGRVVYLEQLPHNANGKIDRKQLKEV